MGRNLENQGNKIRYEFCRMFKFHPVFGQSWGKPVEMSRNQFILYSREHGHEWWNWKIYDEHLPSEDEMIDELEFKYGNIFQIRERAIRLVEPVKRIAKRKTKSGKISFVYQHHIPLGNLISRNLVKQKAENAFLDIQAGMHIHDALRKNHVKYSSLVKYSSFKPKRILLNEKTRKVREGLLKGEKLSSLLDENELSRTTFWRKTGGLKSFQSVTQEDKQIALLE